MEVLKPVIFYKGFETHGILWRFLNTWYLIGVLKGFSWDLKKIRGTCFPRIV